MRHDTGSTRDLRRVGTILARAHRVLGNDAEDVGEQHKWPWPWATACLRDIPMPAHVRQAAAEALEAAREVAPLLRAGIVNGDPGLDGFRLNDRSPALDGLVDWGAVLQGPVLYDLACVAVLTRDTPHVFGHILDGYRDADPDVEAELAHLGTFIRLRWTATAIYFADRIERGQLRGVADAEGNRRGLAEAYAGLRDR
ncbi:phosphotransferase [Nonomuraea sp. NPDC046802]|uniref:phosphotransferase n=1 Tax=Nonomuraea sp. NPDC046802 TaxID=3154919 RepID=UPI0033E96402